MRRDGARQIGIAGPQDASLVQLSSFGAMGVDNQAISLTHRKPSAKIEFQTKDVKDQSARSVPAAADVDIGDLPVSKRAISVSTEPPPTHMPHLPGMPLNYFSRF